ncbi:protein translocase subunit SecF [Rothia sp. (in: high G+C Gram-positive bacteria)]|jgi:protein-export membrane protein secF|uniref:protein translocase subunit SecF n=1 Tax=Rothia sp. (in: high G+C Gram-positive bacteria) TaxID=1885016 RepID=UPI0025D08650|nr:protein translocase subunit SecF [Rothia sp. (in: high G+C Gram-positive bacteria)]
MATDVKPNAFARFGNDLHSGARSYPFVGKRRLWLLLAAVLMAVSVLIPAVGGGFNLGIDFRGGSEFVVSKTAHVDTATGERIIHEKAKDASDVRVTNIAPGTIRAQMSKLSDDETLQVKAALQEGYGVSENDVTSSFVGPTWGADVTRQAFWGLVAFVVLALIGMAFYFRTWKMSLASIAGLFFTVVVTVGLYAAFGFEITPSAIIGFLTILSYSLYDSVVVFDKIRENTEDVLERRDTTFAEQINLAVNQTLVRSINTAIVGVLPVGAILFIGAFILGAGTLQDLSLSLFVGILVGMFGTLFVSAPLYASLRLGEAQIREHTAKVESGNFKDAEDADDAEGDSSEEPAEAEKAEESADKATEDEKATEKPAKKPARATIEIHRVNLNG